MTGFGCDGGVEAGAVGETSTELSGGVVWWLEDLPAVLAGLGALFAAARALPALPSFPAATWASCGGDDEGSSAALLGSCLTAVRGRVVGPRGGARSPATSTALGSLALKSTISSAGGACAASLSHCVCVGAFLADGLRASGTFTVPFSCNKASEGI
jgi:hypothetical protein